ncbi:hypothetical protein K523DRAFT_314262 [Schizophyllum commune Tattone D]|nr:hypothetical protein K523DRAFT_314262 [Schizophyllum commune Tattone D]
MHRQLRSGNTFGEWDGEAIHVVDADFNLASYIQRSIEEERDEASDEDTDYEIEGTTVSLAAERVASTGSPTSPPPDAPVPCAVPDAPPRGHKKRTRERNHALRKRRRQEAQVPAEDAPNTEARASTRRKHIDPALPIPTNLQLTGVRVTKTGYTGMRDKPAPHRVYQLEELVGPNSKFQFDLVTWEGRKARPFVDNGGTVFGLLAGRPDQAPDWDPLMRDFADTIEDTRPHIRFKSHQLRHRRGPFPATPHGHSYGGGQQEPMSISEYPANAPHFRRILEHPAMPRISGYQNGVAQGWAPKLHTYLRHNRRVLRTQKPSLRHNYRASVWAATTVNYGPQTVCLPHKDFANLPWGWCPITALGNYDYKRGGHLVLWELRLVIEFPPGSTIVIPSGILTHSNVPVGPDETRYSITQYTAGALIRWIDQGFQTKEAFLATLSPEQRAEEVAKASMRYRKGLAMYSTLTELRSRSDGTDSDSDLTELEDSDSDLTDLEDSD